MTIRTLIMIVCSTAAFLGYPERGIADDNKDARHGMARMQSQAESAMQECKTLKSSASVALCEATIGNRLVTYQRLSGRFVSDIQAISSANSRILRAPPRAASDQGIAARSLQLRQGVAERTVAKVQTGTVAMQDARAYLQDSLADIADLFANQGARFPVICDLKDTGQITCVELSVLLASHTNEFGEQILSDMARLQQVFELPVGNEVLIGCGPGMWSSMGLPGTGADGGMANLGEFMAETGFDQVLNQCTQLTDSMTPSNAQSLMSAGGSSGMTGFDPLGLMGLCGLDLNGSDADEFTRRALALSEAMHEGCEPTLQSTMMESSLPDELPNGKDEEGNYKPINTATAITQIGNEMERVETIDGQGGFIWYVRASTSDRDSLEVDYQDGSSAYVSAGPNNTYAEFDNPDGSGANVQVDNDGKGHGYTVDSSGDIVDEVEFDLNDPDDPIYDENNPHGPNYLKLESLIPFSIGDSLKSACAGEPCESCFDFNQLNPKIQDAAEGGTERDLWVLRSFDRTATCCGDQSVFPGDPRVAIVNPEADFMCSGGADAQASALQAACEFRCSFAISDPGNCMSTCQGGYNLSGALNLSTWDIICHEAVSEACFIDQGSFDIPPPPTLPSPERVAESGLLIEPFLSWESTEVPHIDPRGPIPLIDRQP